MKIDELLKAHGVTKSNKKVYFGEVSKSIDISQMTKLMTALTSSDDNHSRVFVDDRYIYYTESGMLYKYSQLDGTLILTVTHTNISNIVVESEYIYVFESTTESYGSGSRMRGKNIYKYDKNFNLIAQTYADAYDLTIYSTKNNSFAFFDRTGWTSTDTNKPYFFKEIDKNLLEIRSFQTSLTSVKGASGSNSMLIGDFLIYSSNSRYLTIHNLVTGAQILHLVDKGYILDVVKINENRAFLIVDESVSASYYTTRIYLLDLNTMSIIPYTDEDPMYKVSDSVKIGLNERAMSAAFLNNTETKAYFSKGNILFSLEKLPNKEVSINTSINIINNVINNGFKKYKNKIYAISTYNKKIYVLNT